ncbi:MAG TPA: hypothetical protein VM756_08265 [Burkholderiales bacterium]|nr:hypothetical protein [Burkholderiales bacterium]
MADPTLDAYTSRARSEAFTEADQPSPWTDTVAAAFAFQRREENSNSAHNAINDKINERAKKIGELGGDERLARAYPADFGLMSRFRRLELEGRLEGNALYTSNPAIAEAYRHVRDFEKRFPDLVLDDEGLTAQTREQYAKLRARDQDVIERGAGSAALVGTAGGAFTDPMVLMTAPLGIESAGAKTVLGQIGRTAAAEGGIAMLTEIPIQAQVADFKASIASPWSSADSSMNILAAGAGGAVLGGALAGGVIGYKKALAKYREAKLAGAVRATPEMDAAEESLEAAIREQEANPLRQEVGLESFAADTHARALETAQAQVDAGQPVDVAELVTGAEAPDPVGAVISRTAPDSLIDVDPLTVAVDAKTFQFKGGSDAEGVTSTLRDVERFDRRLAGVALIWERADGAQFIADGHQRLALARRAIAAGQDPAEVRLNGFLLREADGVSAVDARRMAAIKNMAEGSGSPLDAAKILRDVGPAGAALLPPLPPRSALVKQARGLAELGDEEFMSVVNGVIDERFGALVGNATADPKLQSAMIEVLRRAAPANEAQARSIVEQVRTQGVETRTTEDLFGEASFSESLYLERAQVLDSALKAARSDRLVFGGLISNEERIAGAGNRLDRAANLARQQEATDAAQQITIRANAKGALSDALTDAARKVREGAKPGTVAKAFLEAARRELLQDNRGRGAPGGPRRGSAPAGAGQVTQPIRLLEVAAPERRAVTEAFKARQAGQSVEDLYQVAEAHQAAYVKACEEIAAELGDEVEFKNPGVKVRTTTEEKIARKGYKDAGDLTDVIRAGFVTRSPQVAELVLQRLAKTFEILDEGVVVTPLGYVDQKALLRFPDGRVAELQLWDAALLKAKEPEGHRLYEAERAITAEEKATPEGATLHAALVEASKDLYARALVDAAPEWRRAAMMALPEDMRVRVQEALAGKGAGAGSGGTSGNISKKAARVSSEPDSSTSKGSQRDQDVSPDLTKKVSMPPSSEGRSIAGRYSQLKNLSAIDSPPRSIIRALEDPKGDHPTISRTGTVEDAEYEAVMSQYQDLADDHGALLKVTNEVDGQLVERQAGAVIDELDTLEESLERIRLCSVPARAA